MLARVAVVLLGVAALLFARASIADEQPTKSVVFVPPRDIEDPLRDALTAQLSGVAVELVIEHFASSLDSLKENVAESRSLAAAHQAIGVFWLDARSKDEWLVYLAEPAGKRVLMRRVPIGADGSVTAMEVVAVITRESTAALLAGQKIGMTEVVVPGEPEKPLPVAPPPPPPPVAPPKPRAFEPLHGLSLAFSGYADRYAEGGNAKIGVGLAASWYFRKGFRAGATFVALQPTEVDAPGLVLFVHRYPIGLEAGYSLVHKRVLFGIALRSSVELTSRHAVAPQPPSPSTAKTTGTVVSPQPDAMRPVVLLSPRLRFDYRVTEAMNLFVAAGVDVPLNRFSFVNHVDGVDRPILEPLPVRPAGEVGAAFWP